MTYELAKELRDAGFPQRIEDHGEQTEDGSRKAYTADGVLIEFDDGFWRNGEPDTYIPSLEELIEACGDSFGLFGPNRQFKPLTETYPGTKVYFQEQAFKKIEGWSALKRDAEIVARGSIPIEAVARLWLALNKPLTDQEGEVIK